MKIVLTGGGTGGHFFPLIAVAEAVNEIIDTENLADARIYYFANTPFDKKLLFENDITFVQIEAGKRPSLNNIKGTILTGIGFMQALLRLVIMYPDVVFSKGGYVAFPTLLAAKVLGIPVIIHESDSVPGMVSRWSGSFADTVAVSYKQNVDYFDSKKVIHTGQPVRADLISSSQEGAYEFLGLDKNLPVVWFIGGSQGAAIINDVVDEALPQLLPKYQVIHQTGEKNFESIKQLTDATLSGNDFRNRYHPFPFLNILSLKMVARVADVVVTRAGSMLFEIANWEIPAIIVPITSSSNDHQLKNAYSYTRAGAGTTIEENNLSDSQLVFEINRIYDNPEIKETMKQKARDFFVPDAAKKIAREIIRIVLSHEKTD
jgi:UDP-N-acetylglucosamine--N-acetylmuramyl-(pentapeptide) pyrophosphoryl-undecaprenol N-acetylglucosamine transferase